MEIFSTVHRGSIIKNYECVNVSQIIWRYPKPLAFVTMELESSNSSLAVLQQESLLNNMNGLPPWCRCDYFRTRRYSIHKWQPEDDSHRKLQPIHNYSCILETFHCKNIKIWIIFKLSIIQFNALYWQHCDVSALSKPESIQIWNNKSGSVSWQAD